MPDDEGWRPPDDRRPDDTAELDLNFDDDEPPAPTGAAESDLGPLRAIRRRDAAPDEATGVGGERRSTFRRHPARWLGALVALISLGVVAVGVGWTWWHSTFQIHSGSPGSASPGTGSGSPGPTPSGGGTGTGPVVTGTHGAGSGSTVQSGCDSGCSPVDDTCNKACDDTANSCLNSACSDSSCNDSSCNGSSCNDSSCGSGSGGGAAHLAGLAGRVGEWVLAWGHLPAGAPLLLEARRRASVPARAAVRLIRLYQRRASGRLGVSCRYTPSCSRYGVAAIERYGLLDGARLAADRIHRCVPAVPHGTSDPLPGH